MEPKICSEENSKRFRLRNTSAKMDTEKIEDEKMNEKNQTIIYLQEKIASLQEEPDLLRNQESIEKTDNGNRQRGRKNSRSTRRDDRNSE